MIKTTCWDCNKKQKGFCRRYSIAKNSPICELIQDKKFAEATLKLS